MPTIKLQSSEGEILEVDIEVAKQSTTIKTMLELGMGGDRQEVVRLPNVNSATLQRVIEWATYHRDDPPRDEDDDDVCKDDTRAHHIDPWDRQFLNVDQGTLYELILAANYLDIKGLLAVSCKTIANMIIGKTPDEIRQTFTVRREFPTSERMEEGSESEDQ